MQIPCHECPYRKLYCHDRCDEYLKAKEELQEAKRKLHAADIAIDYIVNAYYRREKTMRCKR